MVKKSVATKFKSNGSRRDSDSSKGPSVFSKVKKFWNFVWNDDSLLSWILSIVFAFIIIRFIVYPLLGFLLGTGFPIVAIVSGSMEHKFAIGETTVPTLCGNYGEKSSVSLEIFWTYCGGWYDSVNITRSKFSDFSYKNGLNIGDIIVLKNSGAANVKVGDVIVFIQPKNPVLEPIIHRVVKIDNINGKIVFQTKGDHNRQSINISTNYKYLNEYEVTEDQFIGKAVVRIPYLGYIKIWAYQMILAIKNAI